MGVSKSSPIPLYLQIEEDVRTRIRVGQLGPLDQVPSEIELSEEFHVSRMTARKAVDRLVSEGVLFRQPGKGTFVTPPKIAHPPSTQLSFSGSMDALGLRHSTRVLDADLVPAMREAAGYLGVTPMATVVRIRRLRLIADEPAAIHLSYLPMRYAALLTEDLTGSLNKLMEFAGGGVVHTSDRVEAVLATTDEAQVLGIPVGAPLVRIEGTAYAGNGEPRRFTEALYRSDRFFFQIDTHADKDVRLEFHVRGFSENVSPRLVS